MQFLQLSYYTFLRKIRDKRELITGVILPIGLILILGITFQEGFDVRKLGDIPVAYFNEDGQVGSHVFEEFLNNDEVREWIRPISVESYEEGIEKLQKMSVYAFIHIPKGYSDKIIIGEKAIIEVIDTGMAPITSSIVNNIIATFNSGGNLMMTKLEMAGKDLMSIRSKDDIDEFIYQNDKLTSPIQRYAIDESYRRMSGIDYYAVTMLVMFIMWGVFSGAHGMAEDLFSPMKYRIYSAPISKLGYYGAKSIGSVVHSLTQILIIIFFTKWVYGVYWGKNLWLVVFISTVLAIVAIHIGIAISLMTSKESSINGAINGFVVISTFVAGGFVPIETTNPVLNLIRNLSPNFHAQQAIFNIIYTGNSQQTLYSLLWLLGICTFLMILSTYMGRRKSIGNI